MDAPKFMMNKLMNMLILLLKSETTNWIENSVHVMNYGLLHIIVWTIFPFACNRGVSQRKNGVFITKASTVLGTRSDLSSLHVRCGLQDNGDCTVTKRALIITYTCIIFFSFKENIQWHHLPVPLYFFETKRQENITLRL